MLGEFRQIYNLGAAGDNDKLIRVWGQGHGKSKYGLKRLLQNF